MNIRVLTVLKLHILKEIFGFLSSDKHDSLKEKRIVYSFYTSMNSPTSNVDTCKTLFFSGSRQAGTSRLRERDAKTSFCSFVPYVTFCNHIVIRLDKVIVELCNLSNYIYDDGCVFTYDLFYMNCYDTV